MNWGNKIVLAFVCFAAFIGYMVTKAFQEDFDLVAEDYYAQEINYQQKLVKKANTREFGQVVEIQQGREYVLLDFADVKATGTIQFYHPSREIFDKTYDIELVGGVQKIAKQDLVPGNYRININWTTNGHDFLQESKIFLQ